MQREPAPERLVETPFRENSPALMNVNRSQLVSVSSTNPANGAVTESLLSMFA